MHQTNQATTTSKTEDRDAAIQISREEELYWMRSINRLQDRIKETKAEIKREIDLAKLEKIDMSGFDPDLQSYEAGYADGYRIALEAARQALAAVK